MNQVYKIRQNEKKEIAMMIFLTGLESRGVPMTLFIARLRGVEMELSKNVSLIIDNGILWAGGKEIWLKFLADYDQYRQATTPLFGAKSDFDV